jgi:hypothetical protein
VASAAPAPNGDVVSFEDTWEEEAKAEFGDLGPADSAGPGGPPRPDRGPRRNPRRRR